MKNQRLKGGKWLVQSDAAHGCQGDKQSNLFSPWFPRLLSHLPPPPTPTAQYSMFISKWGKGNEWCVRSEWLSGAHSLLSNHCFPDSTPVEDCQNGCGSSPLPVSILFTMQTCNASQQEVKSSSTLFQFGLALSLTEVAEVSVYQDLT